MARAHFRGEQAWQYAHDAANAAGIKEGSKAGIKEDSKKRSEAGIKKGSEAGSEIDSETDIKKINKEGLVSIYIIPLSINI